MRALLVVVSLVALAGCGGRVFDDPAENSGPATGVEAEKDAAPSASADAGEKTPTPTPTPTDAGGACVAGDEGGAVTGSSCRAESELRDEALLACKRTGLASFSLGEGCSTHYRYHEYTCCLDGVCSAKVREGGETSCKDTETWRTYATASCARDGKTLGSLEFAVPCGGGPGGYKGYSYKCCR